MRFLSRVQATLILSLLTVLCILQWRSALKITTRVSKAWTGRSPRVVVFGDSHSDVGYYPISLPTPDFEPMRHSNQGKLWTEVLCDEVGTPRIRRRRRLIS